MPFDIHAMETNRKVTYKGVEYRVVDNMSSGLLAVIKEEDLINNDYPFPIVVIPD